MATCPIFHKLSVHADAHGQQNIGEPMLVGRLNGQHMIWRGYFLVETPLFDGLRNILGVAVWPAV